VLSQRGRYGFAAGFAALALWVATPASFAAGPDPRPGAASDPRPATRGRAGPGEGERDFERALRLYEARTYLSNRAGANALGFRLLRPASRKAPRAGERSPLLVCLHGAGECGNDNIRQLAALPALLSREDLQDRFRCFVVAPQCPSDRHWVNALDDLAGLIEQIRDTEPVDAERIYLTGFSMGGFGAWALAAQRPELFAAVVPIAGGGDLAAVPRLAGLPIWAVHGDADQVVRCEESRRLIEAIEAAGGSARYSELRGIDHQGAALEVYSADSEILAWMFSQRKRWISLPDWKTAALALLDVLVVVSAGVIWTRKRRDRAIRNKKLDSIDKGAR
jgi:dienelactone hydrolase